MERFAPTLIALSLFSFGAIGQASGSSITLVSGNEPPTPQPDLVENMPPVATDRVIEHHSPYDRVIYLSELATDPESEPLTFTITSPPAFGDASISWNVIHYYPRTVAVDTFKVQARDVHGATAESTVTIVNPYAPVTGHYFGVLGTRGALSLNITPYGSCHYRAMFDGRGSSGFLTLDPAGTVTLGVGQTTVKVAFPTIAPAGLIATIEASSISAFCKKGTPEEFAESFVGQYNLRLTNDETGRPAGFAKLVVSADGSARIVGNLSNGKTWSAGSQVGEIGDIHFSTRIISADVVVPPSGALDAPAVGIALRDRPSGRQELQQLDVRGARFTKQEDSGRNIFGATRTKAELIVDSPALRSSRPVWIYTQGGTIRRYYPQRAKVPFAIDGQNRATQLRPTPPLVMLTAKKDGRFSGTFDSSAGAVLQLKGIFITSGIDGVGLVTGGSTGYVLVNDPNAGSSSTQTETTGTTTTTTDSSGVIKTGPGTLVIGGSGVSVGEVEDSTGFLKLTVDNTDKQ